MAALFAIMACAAHAQDASARVSDYRPVFQACRRTDGSSRLAIRRMGIDGREVLLTVDPATLATLLENEQDLSCAETDDEHQTDTRYIRAVSAAGMASISNVVTNGGLFHGTGGGSFVTGDLCPSRRPLDRAFLEKLETQGASMPVALSTSGLWLSRHEADFAWLRDQERAGALRISWVDHSYSHPYVPGRPVAENFLLTPGIDMRAEILDTERLLIAKGETPSVFFRFPGLVSNSALMRAVAGYHLIVLGADAWLAKTPRVRAGGIILVHLNGNEPAGLEIFSTLLAGGKLPQPFRPIEEAPDRGQLISRSLQSTSVHMR